MEEKKIQGANEPPKINLVSLVKRTVEKVLDTAHVEKSIGTTRVVASVLLNIAAEYLRSVDDEPQVAIDLFTAFMKGTPEEQKLAVQKFGEALDQPKRIIVTSDGGEG
jgi:hypothetical protein